MSDRDARGYRSPPPVDGPPRGARVRSDVIDVYVARACREGWELLQLRRARSPLKDTWQPIMGHAEDGESSPRAAARELFEEVGLSVLSPSTHGFWALEQVHPFYIAAIDSVVLSPRFLVEVAPGWEPTLNAEHTAARWVAPGSIETAFMWPGQRLAIREIRDLLTPGSLTREALRIDPGTL